MPELILKHNDLPGDCYQSELIVSLQNERGTSYSTYINVQNKLAEAFIIFRNEKSIEFF